MSGVAIQIDLRDNGVQALFDRCRQVLKGGNVERVVGGSCKDLTMRHLSQLNARRHRGSGFGFYEAAAGKVQVRSELGIIWLSVAHQGLAQRFYGGRIEPVLKKCLAFPVSDSPASSAGRTNELSSGNGLRAIFFKPKVSAHSEIFGALVSTSNRVATGVISGKGKNAGKTKYAKTVKDSILFLLARWVQQDPDETVMPRPENYRETVRISLQRIVDALGGRTASNV